MGVKENKWPRKNAAKVEHDVVVTHDRVMTPRQLAKYLTVSLTTIRRRVADGTLPKHKFGGGLRFYVSEVDAVIKKMKGD